MWSGGGFPGWKSGMIRDTSLQPGQTRSETFEIKFPFEDVEKDGKKIRNVKADEMDVTFQLWYIPAGGDPKEGVPGWSQFLFFGNPENGKIKAERGIHT